MPFNFLTCDNINILNVPKEIMNISNKEDLEKYIWYVDGLANNGNKYSITEDGFLYLEELPNGKIKLEKTDFTGQIYIGGYFLDTKNTNGNNYSLILKVLFVKGKLLESSVELFEFHSLEEYNKSLDFFQNKINKRIGFLSSFRYRFLYKPLIVICKILLFLPYLFLEFLNYLLNKLLDIIALLYKY